MAEHAKPVPSPTEATRPFWSGCASGALRLKSCSRCGKFVAPTRAVCACGNAQLAWVDTSGRGRIFSYTVVHRAPDPAFRGEIPYVIAVVELEEGPKLMTNITGVAPAAIKVGMPVRAVFDEVAPGIGVPKFEPAS